VDLVPDKKNELAAIRAFAFLYTTNNAFNSLHSTTRKFKPSTTVKAIVSDHPLSSLPSISTTTTQTSSDSAYVINLPTQETSV